MRRGAGAQQASAWQEEIRTEVDLILVCGWNVTRVGDANDLDMLSRAFDTFPATSGRPTLIIEDTHIGYGAPHKQDTPQAHGEPLGQEKVRAAKRFYGWPEDARFLVPAGVYEHFRAGIRQRGAAARKAWFELFETYREASPALAEEAYRMQHRQPPEGWDASLPVFQPIRRAWPAGSPPARYSTCSPGMSRG